MRLSKPARSNIHRLWTIEMWSRHVRSVAVSDYAGSRQYLARSGNHSVKMELHLLLCDIRNRRTFLLWGKYTLVGYRSVCTPLLGLDSWTIGGISNSH